jgi:pyruvate kinase
VGPVRAIVTAPPYAPFLEEVARHPMVGGLRLNTVMPIRGEVAEVLNRLSGLGVPLWVDLKGRQLRVREAAVPPYTAVRLTHPISVDTPVDAYFSDGTVRVRVEAVDGDRLILDGSLRRLVGPGESVNIMHPSLQVEGTLTETDREYLRAMRELGLGRVMLSYVESVDDLQEVWRHLPGADIMLKIENRRGLEFVRREGSGHGRLVAARGDLFVEVGRPHRVIGALRQIIAADPDAVVASRLFESLADDPVPSSADIVDVAFLLGVGYRTFLFGDALCFARETVLEALNLLQALAEDDVPGSEPKL